MSLSIDTLVEGVEIASFAHSGSYYLTALKNGQIIVQGNYGYEEYPISFREYWENLFRDGKRPELLGYALSDSGFLGETLYCIASDSWARNPVQLIDSPLREDNESLLVWLYSQKMEIGRVIKNVVVVENFISDLERLLKKNIEIRQRNQIREENEAYRRSKESEM